MAEKAYVNEQDTVVFLRDDDERLPDYLEAGYREVGPEEVIARQAAEADPNVAQTLRVMDAGVNADIPPEHTGHVEYVTKVRALRKRTDAAREKARAATETADAVDQAEKIVRGTA